VTKREELEERLVELQIEHSGREAACFEAGMTFDETLTMIARCVAMFDFVCPPGSTDRLRFEVKWQEEFVAPNIARLEAEVQANAPQLSAVSAQQGGLFVPDSTPTNTKIVKE